ncbi:amidohydrolase family protein [Ottowia thiooxydans]|uniref:L-fuconolactonase n=1 Tax=Ottowia thiooxydans TaxID=219182 RepID=A0ABV2Q5B3_9BURK
MSSTPHRVIDVHHHYWWLGKRSHRWPAAAGDTLHRSFTPEDFQAAMKKAGVHAALLIQSLNDYDETKEFLAIAAKVPHILGVVGWVPLGDADVTAQHLDKMEHGELLVGIRHLINFEPDLNWLLRDGVIASIGEIARRGLVFDIVPINAVQFDAVLDIAARYPHMSVVLDHLARPPVGQADSVEWSERITRAAALPNVSIKLSVGLDVLMGWTWSVEQLRPYVHTVLQAFGPARVMAASNWPVCHLAADYSTVWNGIHALCADLSAADRADVLGGNAIRIFKLRKSI